LDFKASAQAPNTAEYKDILKSFYFMLDHDNFKEFANIGDLVDKHLRYDVFESLTHVLVSFINVVIEKSL